MTQWSGNADFSNEVGTAFDRLSNTRRTILSDEFGVGLFNFRALQYSPIRCIIMGLNFTKISYVSHDLMVFQYL